MVYRSDRDVVRWDPYYSGGTYTYMWAWLERLHGPDWTLNPEVYGYRLGFTPDEYVKGWLAETWELADPNTYIVHLRKGIHWQDISPANGREFTADDVVYNTHRMYGGGDGFTKPSPYLTTSQWQDLISVTATDKYTVVFKWKTPNPEIISEVMHSPTGDGCMANPEAVKLWGDVNDWHHSIGTGAFILKDYVSGSSLSLVKNPNYWGYDERYPQNKLPYVDTFKVLIIPDNATALAAMRSGKIDALDNNSRTTVESMQKTNPEILHITIPANGALTLDPKNDVAPFSDVNVRKAMQMAIDLPTLAKSYYSGEILSYPATLTSRYMTGWGFPYEQWPQDLKDQYTYNPTVAKNLLAAAGYPNGFKTNIVADTTADLDLLQVIKSYFAAVGIDMEIRTMDYTAWVAFVQTGHKYDQIAFRAAGSMGITSEPMNHLSYFRTGQSRNYMNISDPVFDTLYGKALTATSVDQVKEMVRQGNEIFARQHFLISLLQPNNYILYQPWFKGFMGYRSVIYGTGDGAQLTGFYSARFWIDQNLKKSLGR